MIIRSKVGMKIHGVPVLSGIRDIKAAAKKVKLMRR